jgi:hypothetical protein
VDKYTRLSNPAKFFIKDDTNTMDYNEYLLIARGDIKIKYTDVFPYPKDIKDWKKCEVNELETLSFTAYRVSYDSGETYPLIITNDNIINYNFKLNKITDGTSIGNIDDYTSDIDILEGYTKCFTYNLINAEFYEKVKGTNTQVYINISNDNESETLVKLDTPVVFENDGNGSYTLSVLFTDAFITKYAGKDCYLTFVFNV